MSCEASCGGSVLIRIELSPLHKLERDLLETLITSIPFRISFTEREHDSSVVTHVSLTMAASPCDSCLVDATSPGEYPGLSLEGLVLSRCFMEVIDKLSMSLKDGISSKVFLLWSSDDLPWLSALVISKFRISPILVAYVNRRVCNHGNYMYSDNTGTCGNYGSTCKPSIIISIKSRSQVFLIVI